MKRSRSRLAVPVVSPPPPVSAIGTVCLSALSALPFVVLDLVLMIAAFAAVRSGDATLLRSTFGLHFLAALTVSYSSVACRAHVGIVVVRPRFDAA